MNRGKVGIICSVIATVCMLIGGNYGYMNKFCDILGLVGLLLVIVSYCCLGFGKVLRWSWNAAKFGWFIVPFPYDIATGLTVFFGVILLFLFLPVIPCAMAYRENYA